jgi:hypothetical protein
MNPTIKLVAAGVLALISLPAQAAVYAFNFSGSGVRGSVTLTYEANPRAGGPLGTSPNVFDPIDSYVVTGATGTLMNENLGLSTTITGVVASNPSLPDDTNLLAPASFGHYIVANGVPGPGGVAPGFSYDNLFYPGGSPQTATDYPFSGGFLDIYGLVFTTSSNIAVNFWSNGDLGGLSYGAGFTDGVDVLGYVGGISVSAVPEPATWAMMILGVAVAGGTLRRRRHSSVAKVSFA